MNEDDIKVYQSSKNDVWLTPKWIQYYAYEEQGCDFDPVPYQPEVDALKTPWSHWKGRKPFYNPPYSKAETFIGKLIEELNNENIDEALLLTFTNTSVKWWQNLIQPNAHHIEFIARRVDFNHPDKENTPGAMRPSCLIHLDRNAEHYQDPQATCSLITPDQKQTLKEKAKNQNLTNYQ